MNAHLFAMYSGE